MVLQRDRPLWIAGFAPAAAAVELSVARQTARGVADATGQWRVELPALAAGGPCTLEARCGEERVALEDILIGDVWLCAGQSNMERALRTSREAETDIPAAHWPRIRLARTRHLLVPLPAGDTALSWVACTPRTAAEFSAVGYYFGRAIHVATDVPIGLVNCSMGGTPIEAWLPADDLARCTAGPAATADRASGEANDERHQAEHKTAFAVWERELAARFDRGAPGADGPAATVTAAGPWESITGPYYNGSVVFERTFTLPRSWAGAPVVLHVSPLAASDVTFVNGVRIGAGHFTDPFQASAGRTCVIPGELLRKGENTVSLRLLIRKDLRVALGREGAVWLESFAQFPRQRLSLLSDWTGRIEDPVGDKPTRRQAPKDRASYIYNGMVHPLRALPLRGALWYQGEANVSRAHEYLELLQTFIRALRALWGQGDFPFYLVQVANLCEPPGAPRENRWALLRQAQVEALAEPNTGLAVALDIGDPQDIHPANKRDVGLRLARLALRREYADELRAINPAAIPATDSGPVFSGVLREGASLRVDFAKSVAALAGEGEPVRGFSLETADGEIVGASARVEGNAVWVDLPSASAPAFLTYAWADHPAAGLYNEDGLPALPFRAAIPGV